MMLQKLLKWLDSWDDWINPITLRELRIETRKYGFELIVLSFEFIVIGCYAFIFYNLPKNFSFKEQTLLFSAIPVGMSVSNILHSLSIFPSIIRSRCVDELLGIVPLSPQQQVHGYWAFICIWSIFWNSIFLPFIAFSQLIGPTPYSLLLIPFGSFFLCQIITLIGLSFSARIKRSWEVLATIVFLCFYPLLAFLWYFVIISDVIIFAERYCQPLVWDRGFGFVSLFILLPIMLLLHGCVAYKLSVYGFETWRKSFWRSLLLNLAVYMLFNITAASIWLVTAAIVHF